VSTVGIVGLGSIGRRHARELHAQGAEVIALRRPEAPAVPELEFVQVVSDPAAFWKRGPDAIVVANPTALHVPAVTETLAGSGARVLVEKPLAMSTQQAIEVPVPERGRLRVAYCLRFHPVVRAVAEALASRAIGNVTAGRIRFGSYLPDWHPDQDFRSGYAARPELGGGALRTLSHELDLVQHWLGPVQSVSGVVRAASALGLDVDDVAYLTCQTDAGAVVAVELDFVTPGYDRGGELIGELGRIEYRLDPDQPRVTVTDQGGERREQRVAGYDEMYAEQARDLLNWAGGGASLACTYDEAEHVLEIIEAAEASAPMALGAPRSLTPRPGTMV
jgi:predicted dehydrogenase